MHIARWRLLFKVLPVVALVVGAKLISLVVSGWEPISVSLLLSGLIAADVFLLGFLLSGTLSDFKESERLVGDLAAGVESITDECVGLGQGAGADPARRCVLHLRALVADLIGWLEQRAPADAAIERLGVLYDQLDELEPFTQAPFLARVKQEHASIRRNLTRIRTLADTSFVIAGYAIAEISTGLVIVALLLVELDPFAQEFFFVLAVTLLVVYLLALIRELDQPFPRDRRSSRARVSLRPLQDLAERLASIADRLEKGKEPRSETTVSG